MGNNFITAFHYLSQVFSSANVERVPSVTIRCFNEADKYRIEAELKRMFDKELMVRSIEETMPGIVEVYGIKVNLTAY